MSERWKFQVKNGLFFGVLTTFFSTLFDFDNDSFLDTLLSKETIIRMVLFTLAGIFIVSYFSWKKKVEQDKKGNL